MPPVMDHVLPEPVWPQAKMVALYPSTALTTAFSATVLNTSSWLAVLGSTPSNLNSYSLLWLLIRPPSSSLGRWKAIVWSSTLLKVAGLGLGRTRRKISTWFFPILLFLFLYCFSQVVILVTVMVDRVRERRWAELRV